jgi:hypothetical protein
MIAETVGTINLPDQFGLHGKETNLDGSFVPKVSEMQLLVEFLLDHCWCGVTGRNQWLFKTMVVFT